MPVNPDLAHHRAEKAARTRWGGDTETPGEVLEQAALDRVVNQLVESWHKATPEQKARLRRLYNQPEPVQ
jgi:hypothetical protein